jgi:hypothetical protein
VKAGRAARGILALMVLWVWVACPVVAVVVAVARWLQG